MCRVYFHQDTMKKPNQKIGKTLNYLVFRKVTQLVTRTLVVIRKENKVVKMKPQH